MTNIRSDLARPWLQHLRGPYELKAGVAVYLAHVGWHDSTAQPVTNGQEQA